MGQFRRFRPRAQRRGTGGTLTWVGNHTGTAGDPPSVGHPMFHPLQVGNAGGRMIGASLLCFKGYVDQMPAWIVSRELLKECIFPYLLFIFNHIEFLIGGGFVVPPANFWFLNGGFEAHGLPGPH